MNLLCGSFFELPLLYFLSNPTDFDIMFCDMTLCAMYDHVNVPATHAGNVLTIDSTDCHVGFVRLRNGVDYFRKPFDFDNGPACTSNLSMQATCLRALFGTMYNRWRDISILYKDHVYTLSCPLWPPEAHEWISGKCVNGWPTDNIVEIIVKGGCHLVSKAHGKKPNDDTQWRYSFSQAETILIHNSWTDVQKYIYHLLRIIKRDVVSQCGGDSKTFISNYYIKTLMLWSCEEKPSEFWEDRNIVTSVRELLLDLIEKLIERNIQHYFMPENNIMDDLACNADVENEIRLLIGHGEAEISEIVRKEPKAYQMGSGFIVMPNQSLYPLSAKLSYSFNVSMNKTDDRQLQESTTISICSSHNFFPELEYLYEGIKMHLELSKLNKYENEEYRQDFITSAEELFELSIRKFDYGFTRVRLHPGWSICEIYQQFWLTCGGKNEQNQDLMLYSAAREPETATSFDVRDIDSYLENNRSIAQERMETNIFPFLQEILLNEITLPFNSTYCLYRLQG